MNHALVTLFFLVLVSVSGQTPNMVDLTHEPIVSARTLKTHISRKALREYEAGLKAFSRKDLAQAAAHFRDAVVDAPDFAYAWNNLGVSYGSQQNYAAALTSFRTALSLDSSLLGPHNNAAMVLLQLKDYSAAESEARIAVKLNPYEEKPNFVLAVCLVNQGELTPEAVHRLKRARSALPLAAEWIKKLEAVIGKKLDELPYK